MMLINETGYAPPELMFNCSSARPGQDGGHDKNTIKRKVALSKLPNKPHFDRILVSFKLCESRSLDLLDV